MDTSLKWTPPEEWRRITVVDAHTEGEPLRVILAGFPDPQGTSILERRRHARQTLDHLRTALMWEPRGHADMYGCLITPAVSPEADFGVLFMHNEGYSTMCGHGIIGVSTVALETGILAAREPETRIVIDTPAGLVTARARVAKGRVESVAFDNVPSFAAALDQQVEVPHLGPVRFDLAFGGAFYAYVQAADVGLKCEPKSLRDLIDRGMAIKHAVMEQHPVAHPFEPELSFLYGTVFIEPGGDGVHSRNACVFAEGQVDRSPTGTGVSGRVAIHFARREIGLDEPLVIESLIGTRFTASAVSETEFGPHRAVIPRVEGRAFITGINELLLDPRDPLKDGFILR